MPLPEKCTPRLQMRWNRATRMMLSAVICFAVTRAPADWKDKEIEVIKQPVAGYVSIQAVNMDEGIITVLSTVQAQHMLPTKPCTMLLCEQRYSDSDE